MKVVIIFALLLTVVYVNSLELESEWEAFKTKFNRTYENQEEHDRRKALFAERFAKIEEHNKKYEAGEVTYTQGINDFADRTTEERKQFTGGLISP